jgi:hypothetical protein
MGRALRWGLNHPLFISKAFGKFPEEGSNTLITLGTCEESQRRAYFPTASDRRTLGVDVARFGQDSSVLTYLHGYKFIAKKPLYKRDTTEVVGEVMAMCNDQGWPDVIVVDETGLGAGVVDLLRQNQRDNLVPNKTEIRGVQFGAACLTPEDKERFVNIKARMFSLLADAAKTNLTLPPEDIYLEELPTIVYAYDSKGRLMIESKDEFKRRTGRGSPDHADSLALAVYGLHDEIKVGSFPKEDDSPGAAPHASSMGSGRQW